MFIFAAIRDSQLSGFYDSTRRVTLLNWPFLRGGTVNGRDRAIAGWHGERCSMGCASEHIPTERQQTNTYVANLVLLDRWTAARTNGLQ
jgi:hypothetical protein